MRNGIMRPSHRESVGDVKRVVRVQISGRPGSRAFPRDPYLGYCTPILATQTGGVWVIGELEV
jgi:hypothetical protein